MWIAPNGWRVLKVGEIIQETDVFYIPASYVCQDYPPDDINSYNHKSKVWSSINNPFLGGRQHPYIRKSNTTLGNKLD
jgi:hypothetical protein